MALSIYAVRAHASAEMHRNAKTRGGGSWERSDVKVTMHHTSVLWLIILLGLNLCFSVVFKIFR